MNDCIRIVAKELHVSFKLQFTSLSACSFWRRRQLFTSALSPLYVVSRSVLSSKNRDIGHSTTSQKLHIIQCVNVSFLPECLVVIGALYAPTSKFANLFCLSALWPSQRAGLCTARRNSHGSCRIYLALHSGMQIGSSSYFSHLYT